MKCINIARKNRKFSGAYLRIDKSVIKVAMDDDISLDVKYIKANSPVFTSSMNPRDWSDKTAFYVDGLFCESAPSVANDVVTDDKLHVTPVDKDADDINPDESDSVMGNESDPVASMSSTDDDDCIDALQIEEKEEVDAERKPNKAGKGKSKRSSRKK